MHNRKGFTIVELLIVIVVIAILATITVVAFNGVKQRANNASRITVSNQWLSAFRQYQAVVGALPPQLTSAADGTKYCLGTNFPIGGGGVRRCQNYTETGYNAPIQSDNAALLTELAKQTSLPTTASIPSAYFASPFVLRVDVSTYWIVVYIEASTSPIGGDCGGGYILDYFDAAFGASCHKVLTP